MVCCSENPVDANEVLGAQSATLKKYAEPKQAYVLGLPTQFDPDTYYAKGDTGDFTVRVLPKCDYTLNFKRVE